MNTPLCCPLCEAPLAPVERALRCTAGHSFDQAKQGYWNLLPVQRKRSKDPGDNPAMVAARTAFLEQGFYQPIADTVIHTLTQQLVAHPTPHILDMGCGEGYYTQQVQHALPNAKIIGLDISKHAIKAACKRSTEITWLVASGANMPVPMHSQQLLLVMFSRVMPEAFAKVLEQDGLLVLVWPGEQHLIELRQMIYDDVRLQAYDPSSDLANTFSCEQITPLQFTFTLNNSASIQALLEMTPHSQRMPAERREHLLTHAQLTLTADINVGVFKRL